MFMQSDKLYMTVCFLFRVKSYFSYIRVQSSLHWTNNCLQSTRITRPCLSGQVVHHLVCVTVPASRCCGSSEQNFLHLSKYINCIWRWGLVATVATKKNLPLSLPVKLPSPKSAEERYPPSHRRAGKCFPPGNVTWNGTRFSYRVPGIVDCHREQSFFWPLINPNLNSLNSKTNPTTGARGGGWEDHRLRRFERRLFKLLKKSNCSEGIWSKFVQVWDWC